MFAVITQAKYIHLAIGTGNPTVPVRLSANPFSEKGYPIGFVAANGNVHHAMPEGLPAFIVYNDGGAEIRQSYSTDHVVDARFIVSGSKMLVESGRIIESESPLATRPTVSIHRVGVGMRPNGDVLLVAPHCTEEELAVCMLELGCEDAMMTAFGDVYVDYELGGVKLGKAPVTVLEVVNYQELPRPIVVVDPGHGGHDPGALGFGLKEKDLNLQVAKDVVAYLKDNYEGTFLLTRDTDVFVDLSDRAKMANSVNADLFLSIHVNAHTGKARGYETFVHINASEVAQDIQDVMHKHVADFLSPWGVPDRGKKRANFLVLRQTKCPALLVENLFIDNVMDNELLKTEGFLKQLADKTAEGFARGAKLTRKVSEEVTDPNVLYRVQIGAYRYRKGAEATLERAKSLGFHDAFIVTDKK